MPRVMKAVQDNIVLRKKIFQANFHATLAGNAMVTLIYHRKLEDDWTEAAKALREELSQIPGIAAPPHIIGRSRKQKIFLDANEVEEVLDVPGRGTLRYIQVEGAFSQPNASICTCMLGWAVDVTQGSTSQSHDLLELYCGNGNFTAALATNFRRVVATEISKSSVAAAKRNFEANTIENVFIARMSSEEFTEAWQTGKKFNRLEGINLKEYDFKTLLVDPPRAGLDDQTIKVVRDFERVVYISCNPETLKRDVELVSDIFTVERFAMFDQFPYTHHVECGVYLVRRADAPPIAVAGGVEKEEEEGAVEGGEPESKKQKIEESGAEEGQQ
jgi:tRNA (uracil-5-)-methyltransferase